MTGMFSKKLLQFSTSYSRRKTRVDKNYDGPFFFNVANPFTNSLKTVHFINTKKANLY